MKKTMVLLSALLALAVIIIGCPSGGGGNPTPPPLVDPNDSMALWDENNWVKDGETVSLLEKNLASLKPMPPYDTDASYSASLVNGVMSFGDNFKYGDGWQVKIPWSQIYGVAAKPLKNDVYELDIEFTINKDLEDDLQWVIVDDDQYAGPGGYWGEMSRWKSVNVPEAEEEPSEKDPNEDNPVAKGPLTPKEPTEGKGYPVGTWFKKDTKYAYQGRILITKIWGSNLSPNLGFGTGAAGNSGGAQGASPNGATDTTIPVITFTKFDITKYTWAGEEPIDEGDEGDEGDEE